MLECLQEHQRKQPNPNFEARNVLKANAAISKQIPMTQIRNQKILTLVFGMFWNLER